MSKLSKMARELNDSYPAEFPPAFLAKFGVKATIGFNICEMALVSHREDGEPFTAEQVMYCAGYSDGYARAMGLVSAREQSDWSERERKATGGAA